MPMYSLICKWKHITDKIVSFDEYDKSAFGACDTCGDSCKPVAANDVAAYGTDKYSDDAFRDASEAAGFEVTNTKQVDKLEKAGKMYAVTNPSRYKFKNGKKIDRKKQKEDLYRCL